MKSTLVKSTLTFRLSFEGAVKFMKSDSYDSGLYAKYFDPMRASENDAIRVSYTNGEWTVSSRNVDTARVVAMGLTGCADLDEISEKSFEEHVQEEKILRKQFRR